MMFWALTRFGDEPCPELRGLFEAQCGRQLHLLKPQELTNVASAYGRIGRTAPLLAAVAEEAVHRVGLHQFKSSEMAMLLWQVTVSNFSTPQSEARRLCVFKASNDQCPTDRS